MIPSCEAKVMQTPLLHADGSFQPYVFTPQEDIAGACYLSIKGPTDNQSMNSEIQNFLASSMKHDDGKNWWIYASTAAPTHYNCHAL